MLSGFPPPPNTVVFIVYCHFRLTQVSIYKGKGNKLKLAAMTARYIFLFTNVAWEKLTCVDLDKSESSWVTALLRSGLQQVQKHSHILT